MKTRTIVSALASLAAVLLAPDVCLDCAAASSACDPRFAAQDRSGADGGFPGLPAGRAPKVEIAWNRLVDDVELYAHFDRLVAAWPQRLSMQVIGHTIENREMRVYTLNAPESGPPESKPAMWIDGNVHGNEVQGGEAVLYAAWYLLENEATNERAAALVRDRAFYLLPMVNPDGRASWFHDAHNPHSSRSGRRPTDDDGDGRFDEDGPDDLDGDGSIVQMRKWTPGTGRFRVSADDPRVLEPVPPTVNGGHGDWTLLGGEGLDNDGDGQINEDAVGGYDMNRAWPSLWQPEHVQFGAGPYPLYWPETRCIARFILDHPNIAGVQSFHNAGGMILRGPGAELFGEYPRSDVRVYDELGREGERMLPFYRYMVIWKDLYSVFGGFVNWTYEGLGIISFTNELWNEEQLVRPGTGGGRGAELALDDQLEFGAGFVDWHPFEHPFYGTIEIGGFKKDVGRVPPTFLIEEMVHRNALFALRHAESMPEIEVHSLKVSDLGGGVHAVDLVLRNLRSIPTRTARAAERKVGLADRVTLSGTGLEVLAAGVRRDPFRAEAIDLVERDPATVRLETGIGGREDVHLRWFVHGSGQARLRFEAEKARAVETTVQVP